MEIAKTFCCTKASHADLMKLRPDAVLKKNACAAAKHKIISSWPYILRESNS